jgi:hypothetical protein
MDESLWGWKMEPDMNPMIDPFNNAVDVWMSARKEVYNL